MRIMEFEGKSSKTKYKQEETSVLASTVMMLVFLVESRGNVRKTKFSKNRGPEDSVKEEVLFECFASCSLSFQILFAEMIFFILRLIFKPVS